MSLRGRVIMGLLLTTRRNDGRRALLLNEDAVRGVHVIFNTHRQIRTDESARIHTLVPLTLSSLLPSFLRCVPSIETRSHRVRLAFRR